MPNPAPGKRAAVGPRKAPPSASGARLALKRKKQLGGVAVRAFGGLPHVHRELFPPGGPGPGGRGPGLRGRQRPALLPQCREVLDPGPHHHAGLAHGGRRRRGADGPLRWLLLRAGRRERMLRLRMLREPLPVLTISTVDSAFHPSEMLRSVFCSVWGGLGAFYCLVVSSTALADGPWCETELGKWESPFKGLSDSYLRNQTMWGLCVNPPSIVLWHVVLFSILLGLGLLEVALCGIQVVNGLLGTVCGDCRKDDDRAGEGL